MLENIYFVAQLMLMVNVLVLMLENIYFVAQLMLMVNVLVIVVEIDPSA